MCAILDLDGNGALSFTSMGLLVQLISSPSTDEGVIFEEAGRQSKPNGAAKANNLVCYQELVRSEDHTLVSYLPDPMDTASLDPFGPQSKSPGEHRYHHCMQAAFV